MKLFKVLRVARQELRDAAAYYNRQLPGLGLEFSDAVDDAINRIRTYPEAFALISGKARRLATRKFPYHVVYQVFPDHVLIIAIAHQHRRPDYWKDRLS